MLLSMLRQGQTLRLSLRQPLPFPLPIRVGPLGVTVIKKDMDVRIIY